MENFVYIIVRDIEVDWGLCDVLVPKLCASSLDANIQHRNASEKDFKILNEKYYFN